MSQMYYFFFPVTASNHMHAFSSFSTIWQITLLSPTKWSHWSFFQLLINVFPLICTWQWLCQCWHFACTPNTTGRCLRWTTLSIARYSFWPSPWCSLWCRTVGRGRSDRLSAFPSPGSSKIFASAHLNSSWPSLSSRFPAFDSAGTPQNYRVPCH